LPHHQHQSCPPCVLSGGILETSRLQGVLRGKPSGDVILEKIMADEQVIDNWQRSSWTPRPRGIGQLPERGTDEHF